MDERFAHTVHPLTPLSLMCKTSGADFPPFFTPNQRISGE
jgi:hypothetical protein